MTDQAMSPLRRRMIEDMTIRNLSPKTQQGYIRTIKNFTAFLRRSPDTATFEGLRHFQLHLVRSGVGVGALNSAVTALRFFFKVTLETLTHWNVALASHGAPRGPTSSR